ncbi:MAG: hypothetical protein PHV99_02225 [Candidatus Pacebacteria bacterium]|nr:hypothetical protein [Candidatus Paceibacterota bacterium]
MAMESFGGKARRGPSEATRFHAAEHLANREELITRLMKELREVQEQIDVLTGGANKDISDIRDTIVLEELEPLVTRRAELRNQIEQGKMFIQ